MSKLKQLFLAAVATVAVGSAQTFPAGGIGAHLADGGGWTTTLLLSNFGNTANNVQVTFLGSNGLPMNTNFVLNSGQAVTESSRQIALPAFSTVRLRTTGASSSVHTGWIKVTGVGGNKPVTGTVVFRQVVAGRPDYEAAVPLTYAGKNSILMQFDNTDSIDTAVALANTGSGSASVEFTAWDDAGAEIGKFTVPLNASNQTSFLLKDRLAAVAGKRGFVWATSSQSGIAMFGLRFNPTGAFTTLGVYN